MRLSRLLIGTLPLFVLLLAIVAKAPASDDRPENDPASRPSIDYKLIRRDYPRAERSTFWLEVDCDLSKQRVEAAFDMRRDGQGVGRIPLRQVDVEDETRGTRFRVSCLSEEFVEDSVIHIQLLDSATGKSIGGARVRLKDAAIDVSLGEHH